MFCGRINPSKYFQKPNILRRKQKSSTTPTKIKNSIHAKAANTTVAPKKGSNQTLKRASAPFTTTSSNTANTIGGLNSSGGPNPLNNNYDSQNCINVESLLNDSDNLQKVDNQGNSRDWNNEDSQEIDEDSTDSDSDDDYPTMKMVPMRSHDSDNSDVEETVDDVPAQRLTIDYITSSTMRFKCEYPNCTRRFKSNEALKKHKQAHKADTYNKPHKEARAECPAKKLVDGERVPCGKLFPNKDFLAEHLTVDHSPDDAAFKCDRCSRRFFWEIGVWSHSRAGCGARLVCGWAGCGAAFRHPCRLREHARSHTGDKPYPCRFPNCGWSFRTASKLLRHARRHTGERRHACGWCPRAFPRAEHLRDHIARHHRPHMPCPHIGCHRKFISVKALVNHVKWKHNRELTPAAIEEYNVLISLPLEPSEMQEQNATAPLADTESTQPQTAEVYEIKSEDDEVIEIESDAEAMTEEEETAEAVSEIEDMLYCGRAARTHCTWPLVSSQPEVEHIETVPQDTTDLEQQLLDGDVQVELLEEGETNIYTVRSDLFLHGNILNNEDSVQMASVAVVGGEAGEGAGEEAGLDNTLGIMDTHPASHIMQEELLYTDAVDESAFRVFLLSGEEIQIV